MSRRRRATALLPLLLLGACAALGWKIYDDWSAASADAAAAPTEAAAPAADAQPPPADADLALALPPPERFAVVVERPLFSPTRRPAPPAAEVAEAPALPEEPPPEPEAVEAEPPPVVDFTLVGVVIAGTERYALVERHEDGRVVQVPEGGDVSGWFAVLIDPDGAVFRNGAVEEELLLKYASPVPQDRIPPRRVAPPPEQPAEPADQQEQPDQHQ